MALFPGGWSRALRWYDLLGLLRPSSCVLQTLRSKYNQQYHKLFKDIPLEEVVLKGELPPWESGPLPVEPPGTSSVMGTGCPLRWLVFFSSEV